MSDAVALRDAGAIARQEAEQAVTVARAQADTLMGIVKAANLAIDGKYLKAEAWQTIAKFNKRMIDTEWTKPMVDGEGVFLGTRARARLVNESTGEVIGGAEAVCMMEETIVDRETGEEVPRWKDRYACESMAQTRAQGKVGRMAFAWVAVLAGYESTPAEEMDGTSRGGSALKICPACGKPTIIKGKAEYGGGWLCFKKKGGCGWKGPDNYDWLKTTTESASKPQDGTAGGVTEPAGGLTAGADAEAAPAMDARDAAWVAVKEAREAKGMSRDQVMAVIGRTYPSLKTKGGEVDLSKMDLLMIQNLALVLGQETS